MIIKLQVYGDFDIPVTVKLMQAPSTYSKATLKGLAKRLSFDYKNEREATKAVKELKALGFTEVSSVSCTVGGNL